MAHGRAKRPHQKVKTGCMTCRKRRIKCDEAKPACRQCTDSLRKCEGYQPPQTWLFKPHRSLDQSDHNTLIQIISPLGPMGTASDKRSFQLWIEQTAPVFSCYFGHSFWTKLLPQISVVQPAVKHLLLATSSLVETTTLDGVSLDENAVYQSHYTKAIQATCSSPQIEIVLTACLLFACCEFMQGTIARGLHHIHSGLNIIDEWSKSTRDPAVKTSQTARLIIEAIGPIFFSYIDKAPTYGMGDVTIRDRACTTLIGPSCELPCVGQFTEFHQAHHALDGIAHHIARMMDWRRTPWAASPPLKIHLLLETWHMSFESLQANMMESRKQRLAQALQLLRVYYTMLSVMLRASSSDTERVFEQYEEEFKWMVDKYDDFSAAWAQDESSKFIAGVGNLGYNMGYIPPLFFTAIKCRDPDTRVAALRHLGSLQVLENNWTSCTAYLIAQKIIEVENTRSFNNKRASSGDERNLIRPVEAFITDDRTAQAGLDYATFPYSRESTPLLHETIDLRESSSCASAGQWVRLVVSLSLLNSAY
ncbi:uncharacterized protein Z518_09148 [Rhinocladiella mackenziei CBS 650.93]|uniref:Zn(2)-C6 fungal-type domain-containing protein n=1 Tax=Rhinocladiella mackenziei CBS 650.93 TaxID=1442369 RepID=A0A0D2FHE2_9EURO|nr:uncharacterized protein Z518_09148 [Rhinocladiella mackenziei CBS 650.93]KIX01422.1 hypothetical protein Z518_09148 [Rhinocladiella mackenziei CBS 650.93]